MNLPVPIMDVQTITTFLASIGIPLEARRLDSPTLLPGVTLSDTIPPELLAPHAGEPEATAWAFAAITALGLHPSVLFHSGGYQGKSEGLILTFTSGGYPGAAGLIAAGMALATSQATARGARPYPSMLRWLRE